MPVRPIKPRSIGSWAFTTSNMLVYICYGTTLICLDFDAPVSRLGETLISVEIVDMFRLPPSPHGRRRKGVDTWTVFPWLC